MAKKKIMIYALIGIVILFLFFQTTTEQKEFKKTAGETVTISTDMPVGLSSQLKVTFTLSDNTQSNLWKVKGVATPPGWTFFDKSFTGASGPGHNEICSMEPSGYFCTMIAQPGSTIAKTFTITYVSPGTEAATTFSGDWETYEGGALQNIGTLTTSQITFIRNCGSGVCAGTHQWSGSWSQCSTSGNDCGVCCSCDTAGEKAYNEVQDADCSATNCPADNCNADGCGTHIFGDYPSSVANFCAALESCTSNSCVGTATCSIDTDGDTYAGINPTYSGCYDCDEVGTYATMKFSGASEVCNSGIDENCDGGSLVGNSEADLDCNVMTTWSELDAYITSWAISSSWDKPLPAHIITWSLLDDVITIWALQ